LSTTCLLRGGLGWGEGGLLAAPVGLALDDQLPGGGLEPVDCGLGEQRVGERGLYCKQSGRHGSHEHESFDFLGYTFRPRKAKNARGQFFTSFSPAVSNTAAKAMRQQIRSWRLHRRTNWTLHQLAEAINPIVRGWINYYGRFYRWTLARAVLRADQRLSGPLGHVEIQADAAQPEEGSSVSGKDHAIRLGPIRPLEARRHQRWWVTGAG
jgi:hypothetical protein